MQKVALASLLALTLFATVIVWAKADWVVPKISLVKNGTLEYDLDRNGQVDLIEHWRNGDLVASEQDSNGDGRIDARTTYSAGELLHAEYDLDFDGEFDYRADDEPDGRERIQVREDGSFVEWDKTKAPASPTP